MKPSQKTLNNALTLFLLLCTFVSARGAVDKISGMTRQEARQTLLATTEAISGEQGAARIQKLTGAEIPIKSWIDGTTMHIAIGPAPLTPNSFDLARFMYASDRGNEELLKATTLAQMLATADFTISFDYLQTDSSSITLPLTPDEMIRLKTTPIEDLGFDYPTLLNELIQQMNRADREEDNDENVISCSAALDGKYITYTVVYAKLDDLLFKPSNPDANRDMILQAAMSEMAQNPDIYHKLANAAETLGTIGIKFNISDLSGRQTILTLKWNEFRSRLKSAVENGPLVSNDAILNFLDSEINATYRAEELELTQSHLIEGNTVFIIINSNYSWDELGLMEEYFNRDALLEQFGEMFQLLLENDPELKYFRIALFSNESEEESAQWEFDTETIKNFTPSEEVIEMTDEQGNIRT